MFVRIRNDIALSFDLFTLYMYSALRPLLGRRYTFYERQFTGSPHFRPSVRHGHGMMTQRQWRIVCADIGVAIVCFNFWIIYTTTSMQRSGNLKSNIMSILLDGKFRSLLDILFNSSINTVFRGSNSIEVLKQSHFNLRYILSNSQDHKP